jgi:hypothetical protein
LSDAGLFAACSARIQSGKRGELGAWSATPPPAGNADLLRRVARNLAQADAFRAESPVAAWFPPLLWKGIASDWDSLRQARSVLTAAARQLSDARADDALEAWLALSADARTRLTTAAERLLPILREAEELGLSATPALQLSDCLAQQADALERLDAA